MNTVSSLIIINFICGAYSLPGNSLTRKYRDRQLHKHLDALKTDSTTKCIICKDITSFLHGVASVGIGKDEVSVFARYICTKAAIETDRVCDSVIKQFIDEVRYVFVDAFLEPEKTCGWIYGDSCGHFVDYYSPWHTYIPPKTKASKNPWSQKPKPGKPWKVLQVTDIHLDNDYLEGSLAVCSEPLCCRKEDRKAGKDDIAAPKWGYSGYCDSNILMVHNMFETLVKDHGDVDYILWTGDVPAHNIWNQTRKDQIDAIRQATKLFVQYFPNKKVFPALGNHEGVPVNNFPPPYVTGKQSGQWLLDALADDWNQWLPDDTKDTIKRGGFYTTLVQEGFRIISLNTNYGNSLNWWLLINSTDPAGQLDWLVSVLLEAERNQERVHIIGHIPPDATLKWWSYNYYRIINRFHDTITGQFFGHTHHDEFRVFYDQKTSHIPINVAYVAPSVTTYNHLNPGFRIYDVDGGTNDSTWTVLDHHTYILNLAKLKPSDDPVWELEYSAKLAYGMSSLSPAEWSAFVYRMLYDDDLFQIFYKAFSKQYDRSPCTGACKKNYLCTMNTAVGGGYHNYCNFESWVGAFVRFFRGGLRSILSMIPFIWS